MWAPFANPPRYLGGYQEERGPLSPRGQGRSNRFAVRACHHPRYFVVFAVFYSRKSGEPTLAPMGYLHLEVRISSRRFPRSSGVASSTVLRV